MYSGDFHMDDNSNKCLITLQFKDESLVPV